MSCQEFISNLNGLQDGGNFPKELLKVRCQGCASSSRPGPSLAPHPQGRLRSRLAPPKYPPRTGPLYRLKCQ